jgi:hypothetical protein
MKFLNALEKFWTQVFAVGIISVLTFFIGGWAGGIGLVFFAGTLMKKLAFPTKVRQTDLSGKVEATGKPKGVPQKDGEEPPVMPPPPEFPPKKP